MSRTNLESNLSSAQSVGEKLLILLKKHGPMQASEAGEHLGTTGEAARQQFTKLARTAWLRHIPNAGVLAVRCSAGT